MILKIYQEQLSGASQLSFENTRYLAGLFNLLRI